MDAPAAYVATGEAGAGSYFGPLVAAAVVVDATATTAILALEPARALAASPRQRAVTARQLLAVLPAEVVILPPAKYNSLLGRFGSGDALTAWAHATAAEELLSRFGHVRHLAAGLPEAVLTPALRPWGRGSELVPPDEPTVAPGRAAATLLAVAAFEKRLRDIARRYDTTVPGDDPAVEALARRLYAEEGLAGLADVAKVSFPLTEHIRRDVTPGK